MLPVRPVGAAQADRQTQRTLVPALMERQPGSHGDAPTSTAEALTKGATRYPLPRQHVAGRGIETVRPWEWEYHQLQVEALSKSTSVRMISRVRKEAPWAGMTTT
ncbi:hypothetical protein KCMC57_up53400 [Kitasatospora sp. CMC57]|uniref:Transposase n=1 Tax=Kitasatospora sp. CMC57 TaxID=3231513 RepID=A0AB33K5L3_9ACTN